MSDPCPAPVLRVCACILLAAALALSTACSKGPASVYDYLNRLPLNEGDNITTLKEYRYFMDARRAARANNGREAFKLFYRLLEDVPDTDYEAEALYWIARAIPGIIAGENAFVTNFFSREFAHTKRKESRELYTSRVMRRFGIIAGTNGVSWNGNPWLSLVANEALFPAKDFACITAFTNGRSLFTNGMTNVRHFMSNLTLLHTLSKKFPTSILLERLYADESFLPEPERHDGVLTQYERSACMRMRRDVERTIDDMRAETNYHAVVTAVTVRLRDRMGSESVYIPSDRTIMLLNDYDFVTVRRIVEKKLHYLRTNEVWALIDVDTPFGTARGWTYLKYMMPISNVIRSDREQADFRKALALYNDHECIAAAEAFSSYLKRYPEGYLTDKACYLLWQANMMIGSLVTSKNNPYFRYVRRYPLYFIYDKKGDILRSSNLLHHFLMGTMTNSEYRFKINNDYILD